MQTEDFLPTIFFIFFCTNLNDHYFYIVFSKGEQAADVRKTSPQYPRRRICAGNQAEVNTGSDGTLIEITKLPGRLIVVLIPSKILQGWGPEVECCYIKRTQSWHNLVTWAQIIPANSTNIHRTALHSTHAAPCALLLPSAIQSGVDSRYGRDRVKRNQ